MLSTSHVLSTRATGLAPPASEHESFLIDVVEHAATSTSVIRCYAGLAIVPATPEL